MKRAADFIRTAVTGTILEAIKHHHEDGGADPLPLDVAQKMHADGMTETRECPGCSLPILDVAGEPTFHLHTFRIECEDPDGLDG